MAIADQQLGNLMWRAGDLHRAAELLLAARDRMRRMRVTLDAGWVLVELAEVRLAQGRPVEAIEPASQAVSDFRRREDPRGVAGAFVCLGRAHAELGEDARARPLLDDALQIAVRWGYAGLAADAERALAALPASTSRP